MKRFASMCVAAAIAVSVMVLPASAASYTDISGHAAKTAIEKWSDMGILTGANNKFRPDDSLTRAEMATILQRLLRYPTQSALTFADMKPTDWFASDVLSMIDAGIIQGAQGNVMPLQNLNREQAVTMLGRVFQLQNGGNLSGVTDKNAISTWASAAVGAFADKGIIAKQGAFRPKAAITRAELVSMLDALISQVYTGPKLQSKTELAASGIVNQGSFNFIFLTAAQSMYLTRGVGATDVTFTDSSIVDTLYIDGGGTIRLLRRSSSSLSSGTSLYVATPTAMTLNANVNRIVVTSPLKTTIFASPSLPVKSISLRGNGSEVTVSVKTPLISLDAPNVTVALQDNTIPEMTVNASGCTIKGSAGIGKLTIMHPVNVQASRIDNVYIGAGGTGTVFTQRPLTLTIAKGVSVTVDGTVYKNSGTSDLRVI